MTGPILGTEAIARGLTRGQLRWNYRAIYPNVYIRNDQVPTLRVRTIAAWLWSGRRAIVAGRAAAALHGALWVGDNVPIELLWSCARSPAGIIVRRERIDADEVVQVGATSVTSPARTAFDLGRHLNRSAAIPHLDALARATGVAAPSVQSVIQRHPGARGLVRCEQALWLMDGGAQSPKESWLRLLLIDAGFARPATQIRVTDGFNEAFLDMGWEEPRIGVEYDGDQHCADRGRYVHDIGRNEMVDRQGWLDIHVVSEHRRPYIIHRVNDAFLRRGWDPRTMTRRKCA